MNIEKLNEEIEKVLDESTLDIDRDRIIFDTFGSAITIHPDAYGRYDDGKTYIGLNGSSRGSVYFVGPELEDLNNKRAVYAWEHDIKQKVQKFLKEAADEFDTKVDAFMKELGYERKQ